MLIRLIMRSSHHFTSLFSSSHSSKLRDADLKIRCGEWDTQQEVEPVPHQDRSVKYKLINPLFSPRNLTRYAVRVHASIVCNYVHMQECIEFRPNKTLISAQQRGHSAGGGALRAVRSRRHHLSAGLREAAGFVRLGALRSHRMGKGQVR